MLICSQREERANEKDKCINNSYDFIPFFNKFYLPYPYSGPLCQDKDLKKYREPDITTSVSLSRVGWRFAEQILPDLDNVPLGILGVRRMVCPFPVIA